MKTQHGFTLLETLLSIALSTAFAIAILAAVLSATHASARAAAASELQDHALNILSDLRQSTAYDRIALARLASKNETVTFPAEGDTGSPTLTATISISRPATANAPVVATVTVRDSAGTSVSERQTLFAEAPAPGSVVDQAAPSPTPIARFLP